MDIEQQIDLIKQGANFPRPLHFRRIAITIEGGNVPYPIDVFIDEAGRERVIGVKGLVGAPIGEAQGQFASSGMNALFKQPIDGDGAAKFVAVGNGHDHDMRAVTAAIESGHKKIGRAHV